MAGEYKFSERHVGHVAKETGLCAEAILHSSVSALIARPTITNRERMSVVEAAIALQNALDRIPMAPMFVLVDRQ